MEMYLYAIILIECQSVSEKGFLQDVRHNLWK